MEEDLIIASLNPKKKRGRHPLSAEEREARQKEHNKRSAEIHKRNGYAAQKKYRKEHPLYEIKIRVPEKNKEIVSEIIKKSGMSATQFFAFLILEKYDVDILRQEDKH